MVDLTAQSPCAELLAEPVTVANGAVELREVHLGEMFSVVPYQGAQSAVSAALKRSLGAGLPEVGRVATGSSGSIIWAGQGQYLVRAKKLGKLRAAVSLQSDAWACVALEGDKAADVLARLCPLDLRNLQEGDVARSLIGHMSAVIIRRADGFELMVFRSMAGTLVHELRRVMKSVAAQARI